MSRMWRTVFRSANKRVLVRDDGSTGSRGRENWVVCLLWLAFAGFALYAVAMFVMAYWPWLLGTGALVIAWYCWNTYRRK